MSDEAVTPTTGTVAKNSFLCGLIGLIAGVVLIRTVEHGPEISGFIGEQGRNVIGWFTPAPDAPIQASGFRVLIVYDSISLAKLPAAQVSIFTSPDVSTYCRDHCTKGADGKTPEYRCFSQGTDVSKEPQVWQDAMKLPRQSLPWIVISDGKAGVSCPLPANTADTLALLRKYGGP
jgi:hypothetical protein